ncbi:TIGR03943 family putative permease subunit [Heyndrickxia ginsengihumi]|uniref:TIGR03943 family putative permease subunit n=1 Tax=Heyndrickxia ginsengihumi TaxID=363870 RepID=UPI001D9EAB4C|nr:TIGR03943 family protein [Heyndrickxia ginsengihumi]MBE6182980.1 TIGR03943 family protein [Bacillus sp. (in: firmicutes)]MCM3022797.1 TIGR03943 family protein [Heyndrickxia ginsengihumi]
MSKIETIERHEFMSNNFQMDKNTKLKLLRIRLHTYLKGVLLIGFALLLYKLCLTNRLDLFISPRLFRYTTVALFALMILGIIQIFLGTSSKEEVFCDCCEEHKPPKTTFRSCIFYSLFIIPIITGFMFSNHTLGSSVAKNRQIQLTDGNANVKTNNDQGTNTTNNKQATSSQGASTTPQEYMTQQQYDALQKKLLASNDIRISDATYSPTVGIIENHIDQFVGKEVEIVGFVYRENGLPQNEMVVSRFVITCCIADASVYGMMARGNVSPLKDDTWVRVKGKIEKTTYHSSTVPILNITSLKKIAAPKNPYVYDIGIKLTN